MIIITCKNHAEACNKLVYSFDDHYISSVEYIDNEYNEVLIKTISFDGIRYTNLSNSLHNPIGPARELIYPFSSLPNGKEKYFLYGLSFSSEVEFLNYKRIIYDNNKL